MFNLLGKVIEKAVVEPMEDALDVADGLLEGEIRTKPATRLAQDALIGAGVTEILDDD